MFCLYPQHNWYLFYHVCLFVVLLVCLGQELIIWGSDCPNIIMSHILLTLPGLGFLIRNLGSKSLDQEELDLRACMPCGNHCRNRLLNQRQTNRAGLLPPHVLNAQSVGNCQVMGSILIVRLASSWHEKMLYSKYYLNFWAICCHNMHGWAIKWNTCMKHLILKCFIIKIILLIHSRLVYTALTLKS